MLARDILAHMNKRILSALGLVVAAFLLGVLTVIGWRGTTSPSPSVLQNGFVSLPVNIISTHDTSSKLWTLSIEYPQFAFAPASFNKEISSAVDAHLADFKKNAQDNWALRQATTPTGTPVEQFPSSPFDFIVTWEPAQINAHYISFILRFSSYQGGASGVDELQTFNYDLVAKKDLTFADLFAGTPDYLQKVSQVSRQQLTSNLETASQGHVQTDMLDSGTAPTANNFKNFTFTDYSITIYFPRYQVAPGAFGEQSVILSRTIK